MKNKNDYALTPPMGWNSYDYYDTTVNEKEIKANADYMASHLKNAGWEYVVVDIQWYAHNAGSMRDKFQYIPFGKNEIDDFSRLQPDPNRFPSSAGGKGFTELASYVHSLGLKFGIHIMRGIPRIAAHMHSKVLGTDVTADMIADPSSICGWNPDMYGVRNSEAGQAYYNSLLEMYASWGVDFIKCDDICNTNIYNAKHEIEMLAKAISNCGRSIVLSLSPGPALIDRAWHYEKYANMWRITDDFWDRWDTLKDMFNRCELWERHVSEGCFPDCDMLPIGWVGKGFADERQIRFSHDELRTMMSLWCIFGSPLMIGTELTKLDDWSLSLITNKDILSMLTPKCKAHQIAHDKQRAIWTAYNAETKEKFVALFNLSDVEQGITCELEDTIEVTEGTSCNFMASKSDAKLLELWEKEESFTKNGAILATIPSHGCKVYRIQ